MELLIATDWFLEPPWLNTTPRSIHHGGCRGWNHTWLGPLTMGVFNMNGGWDSVGKPAIKWSESCPLHSHIMCFCLLPENTVMVDNYVSIACWFHQTNTVGFSPSKLGIWSHDYITDWSLMKPSSQVGMDREMLSLAKDILWGQG